MSIRLDRMFTHGRVRTLQYKGAAKSFTVPRGKSWLVLCGWISHVTGTSSILYFRSNTAPVEVVALHTVDTGVASGTYNLFSTKADLKYLAWQPIIISSIGAKTGQVGWTAAATAVFVMQVLEW